MKIVSLAVSAPIAGPLRHPSEGPFVVSDDEAEKLKAANMLDGDPEDLPDEEASEVKALVDDLDGKTLIDLGLLVTKEGVPLNGATLKADIIAAIRAHRAPKA